MPGTFVYQYLFAKVGTKILDEGFKLEYLWDADLLLALGLFVAFIVAGNWLAKKASGGRKPRKPPDDSGPSAGEPPGENQGADGG